MLSQSMQKKYALSLENCFHLLKALNVNKSGDLGNFFFLSGCFIDTCGFPSIYLPLLP